MKKIISLILTFTILAMMAGSVMVNAEIPAGNGKGVELAFKTLTRNSPSSGTYATFSALDGTDFDNAYNYTYKGGSSNNKAFVKVRMDFTNTQTITTGDKIYISFYYRFNESETYKLPTYFNRRTNSNVDSGSVSVGTISTEWQKAEFITTSAADVALGTDVTNMFVIGEENSPISMDIAEPTCVYFGAVTGEDADAQIQTELDKSAFTSISIGDTAIDLTANPTSYTTADYITSESITAVGYYDNADIKISSAESDNNTVHTITSYALGYDKTDSTDTKYTTYTINSAKDPITVNNGKGKTLTFGEIERNSPSDGPSAPISVIEDAKFGTVNRYEYVEATKSIVQFSLYFANNENISVDDTIYLSFYYRFTDDATYDLPSSIQHRPNFNLNDGSKPTLANNFVSGEWRKATVTAKPSVDVTSGSDVFLKLLVNLTSGSKICMDIANPTCVYFGKVADENEAEINAQLDKSAFSSISIGDTPIDLTANPTSYTTTDVVSAEDITAIGYHEHSVVKITSEADDTVVYTLTSYATGYDFTNENDTRYTTYTITSATPISVNNGKGKSLEFNGFAGARPSDPLLYTVVNLDGTSFNNAYRYEYLGTYNADPIQNQLRFRNDNTVAAGDYFYISFYYRFVKDDTHVLPTSISRRPHVNSSSSKSEVSTGVVEEWTKAEFIVTSANDVAAGTNIYLNFLLDIEEVTDKIYMDVAEPVCVYFGAVNTEDVNAAINEQVAKYAISGMTIGNTEIDLSAYPESYTTTETVAFDDIKVEGYHNPSVVKIAAARADDAVTYTVTVYAIDYDFLDSLDTRKTTYTINAKLPDYDIYKYGKAYSFATQIHTVKALFDNNTSDSVTLDYIVAAYDANGKLVGAGKTAEISVDGGTAAKELTATMSNVSGTIEYVKIFVWNANAELIPVVNSRVID